MEKLYFHIRPNRRASNRIEVKSKSQKDDQNAFVGSYQEDEPPSFLDSLDDQELFELDWYNQCLAFNHKNFGKKSDEIEKYRFFLTPEFFNALIQLSKEAAKRNLPYNPMESMLNSLLEKAKAVERSINKQDGQSINILEKLGINLDRGNEAFQQHRKFEEGRVIFAELVNIPEYYNQFLILAKERFGKNKINAMPKHFLGYSKGHTTPSKWYYSVALEMLAKNGIDVFNLGLEPKIIIPLWLKPLVIAGYKQDEITKIFSISFKPNIAILDYFKIVISETSLNCVNSKI